MNPQVEEYIKTISSADLEYFQTHRKRFEDSLELISKYVNEKTHILEIGSPYIFTKIIEKSLVYEKLCNTWQDLRNPLDFGSETFDVVICMEVLEHIKDLEESGYNETFHGWGQSNLIKECFRVLKPNGVLFLTTPNPNSILSLKKLLNFEHPFTYWFHIRETSINDLKRILAESGFNNFTLSTKNSWYKAVTSDSELLNAMEKFGFSKEFREDNIFVIAHK